MFDIAEKVEKALKALMTSLGEMLVVTVAIAFRPKRMATRCLEPDSPAPAPRTFLALTTFAMTKTVRIGVVMLYASTIRGCEEKDTLPDLDLVASDYLKAQLTWPSVEDVVVTTIPIVVLALVISKLAEKLTSLRSVATSKTTYITGGICYAVGSQCIVVAPFALIGGLASIFLLNALNIFILLPALFLLFAWPCWMFYRFMQQVYVLNADGDIYLKKTRALLLVIGTLSSIIPFSAAVALCAYLIEVDEKSTFSEPAIKAVLLNAVVNNQSKRTDIVMTILNNMKVQLLIKEACVRTDDDKMYCGSLVKDDKEIEEVSIGAHQSAEVRTRVTTALANPFIECIEAAASTGHLKCSADFELNSPSDFPLHSFPNSVSLHSYFFDRPAEWIAAHFNEGTLSESSFSAIPKN
jgi:hypothetical protein